MLGDEDIAEDIGLVAQPCVIMPLASSQVLSRLRLPSQRRFVANPQRLPGRRNECKKRRRRPQRQPQGQLLRMQWWQTARPYRESWTSSRTPTARPLVLPFALNLSHLQDAVKQMREQMETLHAEDAAFYLREAHDARKSLYDALSGYRGNYDPDQEGPKPPIDRDRDHNPHRKASSEDAVWIAAGQAAAAAAPTPGAAMGGHGRRP